MSRRKKNIIRKILPDYKFHSREISKFINILMLSGKKSLAEKIIYNALKLIKNKTHKNPKNILLIAIKNCQPLVEMRSKKIGGGNYQIPVEVSEKRKLLLSLKWLRDAAKLRSKKNIFINLAEEIIDAFNNKGNAIKKRENIHKMAEANKAFSHIRF